jgi:hypothetical protein
LFIGLGTWAVQQLAGLEKSTPILVPYKSRDLLFTANTSLYCCLSLVSHSNMAQNESNSSHKVTIKITKSTLDKASLKTTKSKAAPTHQSTCTRTPSQKISSPPESTDDTLKRSLEDTESSERDNLMHPTSASADKVINMA